MKKTLRTLMMGMMALLACNALISCSNDDEPQVAQQEGQKGYVEFTLTRGADTRITYEATSEGGLDAFWSEGDKMVIFYKALTDEEIVEVFDLVEGAGTKTARFAKSDSQLADKSADEIEIVYLPNYDVNKSISENLFDFSIQDGTFEGLGKYDRFTFYAKLTEGKIELFDKDFFDPVMLILHFPTDIDFGTGTGTTTLDFVFSGGVNKQVPYDSPTLGDITVKGVSLTNGKLDEDLYVAAWSVPPTSLSVGGKTFSLPEIYNSGKVYTFAQENLKEIIPLTIEPVSSDIEITITNPLGLDIDFCVVNSDNTIDISGYSGDSSFTIPLKAGQRLQLFGDNATYFSNNSFTNINCSGPSKVYGNIMSLINSDNYSTLMELPTTDSEGKTVAYTFAGLFLGDTGLTDASGLLLPATTLTEGCYTRMFDGCNALTTAPALPATTLTVGCYYSMFYGCTSLTTAPQLPANTLKNNCYRSMFFRCTSLTTAPELPATTLAEGCYDSIFYDCTSLTSAPELPATTLARSCYYNMFNGCTSLTTAPELKASTLAPSCYGYMFAYCNSLTTAPELPATITIGAEYCYAGMFNGCKSLTKAPELKTEILVEGCYYNMFRGCSKLSAVTCLAANISATDCTTDWLEGVAVSGTFTKASSMMSWETGASGIPSGWTVANY